ncbi:MAG: hypothetical protein AB1782_18365 [Cyanobacteriota bacterium]
MDNNQHQELINTLMMIQSLLSKVQYNFENLAERGSLASENKDSRRENNRLKDAQNTSILNDFEKLYSNIGYITCWENGNSDRLSIFSKDMQIRASLHVENTIVINMGTGRKIFKAKDKALEFLVKNGLKLKNY